MEEKYEKLLAFVKDMAEHGGRFDTNPTMNFTAVDLRPAAGVRSVVDQYKTYLTRIDSGLQKSARDLLAEVEG